MKKIFVLSYEELLEKIKEDIKYRDNEDFINLIEFMFGVKCKINDDSTFTCEPNKYYSGDFD